jgi:glycosyltransferase involved in cell wall biosynthesis
MTRPDRVLLLIKGLGRGGAEYLLTNMLRYADRSTFSYEVAYLLPWKNESVADLDTMGIPAYCLDGARGVGWVARLRGLVRSRNIRLVHAHSPYAAIGARLGLPRSIPFVYTEHNLWQRYRPETRWGNTLTFPRNDYVIAVSEQVRASIHYPSALRALRAPPVQTLYHGVDHAALSTQDCPDGLRASLGLTDANPVVGTVANLKAHKGHRYLLSAAVLIRRSCPDVRFVLVGRGPLEDELRQQARRMGLDGTVIFTGFREDAARIASIFDVFVLPSEHEGLPIALVEAMALGRPVVVTDAGGNAEVVRNERDGLVVPTKSPKAIAEAVVSLLRDDGLRSRMADAATQRSMAFDIAHVVPKVERIYERLVR